MSHVRPAASKTARTEGEAAGIPAREALRQRVRIALGLVLGFAIGGVCQWLAVPSPAPPVLAGAMLVVSMTLGYTATDRYFARHEARHGQHCGGPDGS